MLKFFRDLFRNTSSPETISSTNSTPIQVKDLELQDNIATPLFTGLNRQASLELKKPIAQTIKQEKVPDQKVVKAFRQIFLRTDPLVLNHPNFDQSYFTRSFLVEKSKISADLWGQPTAAQKKIEFFIHKFPLASSSQLHTNIAIKQTKGENAFKAYVISVPKEDSDHSLGINPTSLKLLSTASIKGIAPKFYRVVDSQSSFLSSVYKTSFITRFANQGSLKQYLSFNPALTLYKLIDIGRQLLEKISILHAMGIAHRDIKPHNILVDLSCDTNVLLIDFGFATQDGQTTERRGSISYCPPEYNQSIFGGFNYKFKKNKQDSHQTVFNSFSIDCYTTGLVLFYLLNRENYDHCINEYISANAEAIHEKLQLVDSMASFMQFKQDISDKVIDEVIGQYPENLVNVIKGLVKMNPDHRSTIDEALALWTDEKILKAPTTTPQSEEEMDEL